MPRRRLIAVLFAVPVLLAGCGSDDDDPTVAAPSSAPSASSTAPSSTAPAPTETATDSPVAQWWHAGGETTLQALGQSTVEIDVTTSPVDTGALAAQCQQLITRTEAAQALPPFPQPAVENELRASYPGLIDIANRCISEASAGVQDPLRSGLTLELVTAYAPFNIALGDAVGALATG